MRRLARPIHLGLACPCCPDPCSSYNFRGPGRSAPSANQLAVGETDPTGGTVLSSLSAPFVAGTYSGTLISQVISGDPSNPLGGLTFTYLLTNNLGMPTRWSD